MPPQTRTRGAKFLRENIGVEDDPKTLKKSTKPPRKALADKTNSLSDDNDSTEVPKKARKPTAKVKKAIVNNIRSRRDRRLPTRFIDNSILKNLSNKDTSTNEIVSAHFSKIEIVNNNMNTTEINNGKSPNKNKPIIQVKKSSDGDIPSPFKTPSKDLESSLVINRPKRIHRLPSRFEDHSISPNKFIPVQPCHASTPLLKKAQKNTTKVVKSKPLLSKVSKMRVGSSKATLNKKNVESPNKSSPDSNNNPKRIRPVRQKAKAVNNKSKSPIIGPKSKTNGVLGKRLLEKSISFKILEDKQMNDGVDKNLDVYEFTFDPDEEPPPQKKKKKRVIRKKSPKPKAVMYKNNYNDNVSKALTALKNMISKKPLQKSKIHVQPRLVQNEDNVTNKVNAKPTQSQIFGGNNYLPKEPVVQLKPPHMSTNKEQSASQNQAQIETNTFLNISTNLPARDPTKNSIHMPNYPSIRIEDIAADFELSDHHDDINYSPVNSPSHPVTPNPQHITNECLITAVNNKDPLSLQGESFFDNQPVASSSMNASIRHPLASPWRVEFGSLPIKWQVNTYVKPNMTPAVESSFINSESNNNKKHVYTNMIADGNNSLPHIDNNTSNLKQTSIISFIKEVAERHASRKKRGVSVTPTKANSLFEDITNTTHINRTPLRVENKGGNNEVNPSKNKSNGSNESIEKENSRENGKRKNENKISEVPAKSPRKQRNKDCTYFGFDDSENQDQENMLSSKHNLRVKALKPRSQAILQEVNRQMGPTRIALPVAAKSKKATSSEAVNKVYEEIKSAEDAPTFLDKNGVQNPETINIDPSLNNDDSESVHLFEDIEFVHHLKAIRKSYVKAKKVTFQKKTDSDSDVQPSEAAEQSEISDADDLADLTFTMPTIKEKRIVKKKKTKKKMSKKEEQEVEAWAAGFNSMCEDVEEFPLVVE